MNPCLGAGDHSGRRAPQDRRPESAAEATPPSPRRQLWACPVVSIGAFTENNNTVMMVLFIVLGAKLLGTGISVVA
jgi:hypothetical protein